MKELLKQYGFDFVKACSCTGIYKETYKRGSYRLDIATKLSNPYFILRLDNKILYSKISINELEKSLQETFDN